MHTLDCLSLPDRGRFSDQSRYEKGVPLNDERRLGPSDTVGFNEDRRLFLFFYKAKGDCCLNLLLYSTANTFSLCLFIYLRRGREGNRQDGRVGQWDTRNDRKRDHNHEREHGREREHGPRPYDGGQRPLGPNNSSGKRNEWEWDGRGRYFFHFL